MKIFFVDPQSYSNLAIYDYNLLSNIDYQIYFYGSYLYDCNIPKNVSFFPLFRYNNKWLLFKFFSYFFSIIKLFFKVLQKRPNIIHIQWIRCFVVDYIFLLLVHHLGIKVIYTAHNILPHNSGLQFFKFFYRYYFEVDGIIVHTDVSKKELINSFNVDVNKIMTISHGVLNIPFDIDKLKCKVLDLKHKFHIDNQLVFLIIGLQSFYKGSDLAVKVWDNHSDFHDINKFKLLVIGKNDNNFCLTNYIKNAKNIDILCEYISDLDFRAYLELSDVLLMPYRSISQSGVLLTAINAKIPFVVSDSGGLAEPLSIADVGWCIGKATEDNLYNCLKSVISNIDDVYNKRKTDEWNKLINFYSWEKIGLKTKLFYDKYVEE